MSSGQGVRRRDLQIDASALPGKAFDLSFEMPEPDVGIMTFNRCPAPLMFEALGREDILEQNCHAVCPASIEETAKLYNPNMKMDILAIPSRASADHECCVWKLSIRDESDPEYVPVSAHPESPRAEPFGRTTSNHTSQGSPQRAASSTTGLRPVSVPVSSYGARRTNVI